MIRASCQKFRFILPYKRSQIKAVRITFWQFDNSNGTDGIFTLPTKTLDHCDQGEPDSKEICVTLHQEETKQFSTQTKAFVQFRGLTTDDCAFSSKIMPISVYPSLDDEVME